MPPKLRSKIVLESQGSCSNAGEAAQVGVVLAMVEQLEKNLTSSQPIQDKDVSENQT